MCAGQARRDLWGHLERWGLAHLADRAGVVVSELLTNAVQHANAPRDRLVETRYERVPAGVRIEVHDADEIRPVVGEPSETGESGRGLCLVDALTNGRWGSSGRSGVGKLVWAVVTDEGDGKQPEGGT
ncbi:ATP-binding protein [Streptomyces sp. NBC_01476]|uniref:ATP-binding protein n=1 Tax=Streptomyces sp. NBC_01476 TaxID=2903881 RepID=UPI002E3137F1|nr:ATP-binding protein [Streptomyces sp. NBC_01476]